MAFAVAMALAAIPLQAQEVPLIETAREKFRHGDYPGALEWIDKGRERDGDSSSFVALQIRVLLETGNVERALQRARSYWRLARTDPDLALAAVEAMRAAGQLETARAVANESLQFPPTAAAPGASRDAVAYAGLLLEAGTDARVVLERFLEPAKKADPAGRDAWLAIGRLALTNHDRKLAAENFREGLKRFPDDPEFALGMALAGVELPADRQQPAEGILSYLDVSLRGNPKSTAALLHKASGLADRKDFAGARETLKRIFEINPNHPEAWAELAAIELLEENADASKKALASARKQWSANPRIPQTVGVTLAKHYRFAEAIPFLKQASQQDPRSAAIRFDLGSTQLRFGQLDEAWVNVEAAHEMDPYNVAAFNLIALRDKLKNFPVLEKDGVRLRMSPEDAAVFGTRALDLAVRAKQTLAKKYQVTLNQPLLIELLPKQEDFAIRTFGLPGGEAFLGVCFGPVITMTSPRGRLGRANWQAVLWHEIAHTVTLQASRHRIPRWLSEGISVFEEREAAEGWGQEMNSSYRERFLSGKMPDLVKLDESFAGPDIQFGYYHASVAAEFIVRRFGIDAMRGLLADLAAGKRFEDALAKRTMPVSKLEAAFREHAKQAAESYGPGLDWAPLTDDEYRAYRENPAAWVAAHPDRYPAAMTRAAKLLEERDWLGAKSLLEKIIAAAPDNREEFSPYSALASACRGLGDEAGERAALEKRLRADSNDSEAAARLLETSAGLPPAGRIAAAERMLLTQPFQELAYRTLFAAARETGDTAKAREACHSLLALEPRDASRLHYELATLLRADDPENARRQVLKALEQNPRFELALEFLVSLPASP